MEHGVINWKEILDTRPFAVGGHIVTDSHKMASGGLYDILKYSSNIGMAHIAMRMQPQWITGKLEEFGLGQESGTGLMGESSGMVPMRSRWSNIELATLGFGYGLRVTPLQLTAAYAALANKGIRKPISVLKVAQAPQGERVIAPEIAEQVIHALEGVVEEGGTGGKAAVPGYRVAGKTGTAENPHGRDHGWFIAYAPAKNPSLVVVCVVEQGSYGSVSAAPIVQSILEYAFTTPGVKKPGSGSSKDKTTPKKKG